MLRHRALICTLISALAVGFIASQAASKPNSMNERPYFSKLIGPHTLVFMHIRFADMLNSPAVKAFYEKMPDGREQMEAGLLSMLAMKPQDIESFTVYLDQLNGREMRPPYILVRTKQATDKSQVFKALGETSEALNIGKTDVALGKDRAIAALDDHTFLLIMLNGKQDANALKRDWIAHFALLEAPGDVPEGLKPSLELALSNKHHGVVGFALSKELSEMAQEQLKKIPPAMAPFKALGKVQSGTVTMDYLTNADNDFKLALHAKFEDAGSAKAGLGAVRFALAAGKIALSSMPKPQDQESVDLMDFAKKQLDVVKAEAVETELHLNYEMSILKLMPMLLSATERVRFAADKMLSASNMRQLMIAMHNYHSDYNSMPLAFTEKNGKRLHSWRVNLLPYLEGDNIYKQIKADEPWNSEYNKKFFESIPMPKLFEHPGKKDGASKMTYYKVFYSKADAKPSAGFQIGKKWTLGQITVLDGTSNSICLIESGPPVLWYQPEDIEFDAQSSLPQLTSPWKQNLVNVGFFDASVRTIWLGQEEDALKAAITVNGGETYDFSKLEEKKTKAKK